mmetsp:Transcript_31321/g.57415  ORF Transcript_31321/g.57415 Transcript_31321/m.57415 type:complete len:953 (+) Transcript_31321:107-2965(+)
MSQSQRRGARGGAEPSVSTHRRERDINSERLVFVLAGLVGHRVTAKLRNNVTYEGVFHGCSMEDFSITLKSAQRLTSDGSDSGEVVSTLVIPGKDFLLIAADDVSCQGAPEFDDATGSTALARFATDSEISQKKAAGGSDRELVPWAPSPGEVHGDEGALGTHSSGQWDQFQKNEEMFGITTTFNEELYTTKLDPNSISREKREQADRIAREIESGTMAAEAEGALNGEDGDEEAQFSAVAGTGYYRRKDPDVPQLRRAKTEPSGQGSSQANGTEGSSSSALAELSSQVPLTKETLVQHDSLTGVPEGDALKSEHRRQRGIITAQTPLRNPMILEMKRINALNLEPALPKLDDKTRNDWINFKQSQNRNASTPVQGDGLKMEFQQSLEQIQKREASKKQELAAKQEREAAESAEAQGRKADSGGGATSSAALVAPSPSGERKSGFSFNPQAKEFNFNPQAAAFTPTSAAGSMAPSFSPTNAGGGMQASPSGMAHPKPTVQAPPFLVNTANDMLLRKSLLDLLDPFFDRSSRESADYAELVWPDASGPSFHEVLGQPNPANPMPPVGAIPQGGGMPWQQQQQQQAQQDQQPQPERDQAPLQTAQAQQQQMFPPPQALGAPVNNGQCPPQAQEADTKLPLGDELEEIYEHLQDVGVGVYGTVYKARDRRTDRTVAVKKLKFGNDFGEGVPAYVIREVSLLRDFEHPNIVQLLDIHISGLQDYSLIFEYMDRDLHSLNKQYRKSMQQMPISLVKRYSQDLLNGLHACHLRLIMHRDLKPQNILIAGDSKAATSENCLKIADFGMARAFSLPIPKYTHEVVTTWYRAPEILFGSQEYALPIDMWSAGCIMAEMAHGSALFRGDSEIDTIFQIFQRLGTPSDVEWPGLSSLPDFKLTFPQWRRQPWSNIRHVAPTLGTNGTALLDELLKYDPRRRISAKQALMHSYFTHDWDVAMDC